MFVCVKVGETERQTDKRRNRKGRKRAKVGHCETGFKSVRKEDREKETTDKLKKYMRFFCCKNRCETASGISVVIGIPF